MNTFLLSLTGILLIILFLVIDDRKNQELADKSAAFKHLTSQAFDSRKEAEDFAAELNINTNAVDIQILESIEDRAYFVTYSIPLN